jgi:hypothetical protein
MRRVGLGAHTDVPCVYGTRPLPPLHAGSASRAVQRTQRSFWCWCWLCRHQHAVCSRTSARSTSPRSLHRGPSRTPHCLRTARPKTYAPLLEVALTASRTTQVPLLGCTARSSRWVHSSSSWCRAMATCHSCSCTQCHHASRCSVCSSLFAKLPGQGCHWPGVCTASSLSVMPQPNRHLLAPTLS